MTVSSVATGYDGISLLAGNTSFDPAATFLIQRVTSTGSSTSLTFSGIPSTYKHLQIRGIAYDGIGNPLQIQFNGDTGSNYAYHRLQGTGSTASTGAASTTEINFVGYAAAAASNYGSSIIDIHDYSSTSKYKTSRAMMGYEANGSGLILLNSGLWMNTSAITSITILASSALSSLSTFALYGMVG